MLNPSTSISAGNPADVIGNSSNLYSSISSQGMDNSSTSEEAAEKEVPTNPAETAIQRFGQVFDQFNTLTSTPEYAMATKEADAVKMAMKNWLEAVVAATSKSRGESTNY